MDAFEYLERLPAPTLDQIYSDPWSCQAVVQSLPPLAKQLVLRLLFVTAPFDPPAFLSHWLNQHHDDPPRLFNHALHRLKKLRLLLEHQHHSSSSSMKEVRLHPEFQRQLQLALARPSQAPWPSTTNAVENNKHKTSEGLRGWELERFARAKWESVLHFMVGSTAVSEPPQSVVEILLRTKLMQTTTTQQQQQQQTTSSSGGGGCLHITESGYEFMLRDVHVQMWIFMLEYIKTIDTNTDLKREEILQFLFQLSYCQTNHRYAVAELTETQRKLLLDFSDFGLLYRPTNTADHFYTTSLAVNIIFGGAIGQTRQTAANANSFAQLKAGNVRQPEVAVDTHSQLVIIVETNFKVYAYTSSALHVAMLSVFVDIVTRLPNLAVGFITRESLRSALMNGISAQQIYDFLMKHAHPNMLNNSPVIPENIADQLYLWERERNRIQFYDAILYTGFYSKEEFEQVLKYSKRIKVYLWSDPVHFKISVSSSGEENMRSFMRSNSRR